MAITTEVFEGKFNISQEGVDQLSKALVDLEQIALRVTKSLKELKLPKLDNLSNLKVDTNLPQVIDNVTQAQLKTKQATEQATQAVKNYDAALKAQAESAKGRAKEAAQAFVLDDLVSQFNRVEQASDIANRSLGRTFSDIRDGFGIIRSGGSTLVGLRAALVGAGETSTVTARAFDGLIKVQDRLGAVFGRTTDANLKLAQASARTADQITKLTSGLGTQVVTLKQVSSKELGLVGADFRDLDNQVRLVENQFKRLQSTARAGLGISPKQIASAETELDQLERTFQEMVARGILPIGSASRTAFEQIINRSRSAQVSLRQLAEQQNRNVTEAKASAQAQRQQANETERQGNIVKRVTFSFANFFNIFRTSQTTINNTTQSVTQLGGEISRVSQVAERAGSVFRDVFLGTLLGSLTSGALRDAFAFLRQEFFASNDAVQNFRITIANMLKGTDAAVEDVQEGVEAFIRDVVAKTPFELTDAFASFQRLLTAGFDPKEWLTPVADAAAAVNKPMEQLIGALQKIQVGAKGAGIEMLRDFGIPVNQVGAFVDETTGQVLDQNEVLNDSRNLYELSAEELAKLGVSFRRLEFDKQGALINNSADALQILNGYLSQNATFAGAAESRSRSLTGVISNLKDAVTNILLVAGQPIFERLTEAGTGLLGVIGRLEPQLNFIAERIGVGVANAITFATHFIANFSQTFDQLSGSLQTLSSIVSALFSGEWQTAWEIFAHAVLDGVQVALDSLNSLSMDAFDWGVNFVVEIANGVIDAAGSILLDAVNYVSDLIGSFLAPGSPPEQGPLSDIDQWGSGLMDTFFGGFRSATARDLKFVTDALDPIGEALQGVAGGRGIFQGLRQDLFELAAGLRETGELNQDLLNNVLDKVPDKVKPIIKSMADQLAIQEEVAQAEKEGFVGADLKLRLQQQEGITDSIQELSKQEDKFFGRQDRVGQGLQGLDQLAKAEDDLTKRSIGGAKKASKAKAAAAKAARKGIEREKETIEDRYRRELELLEEKRRLGLLSEEEYIRGLLKIEKDFVEGSIEGGVVAGLDSHIAKIKELEAELVRFSKKGAKKAKIDEPLEIFDIPTAGEILKGFVEETPKKFVEVARESSAAFIKEARRTLKERFQDIVDDIGASIREASTNAFQDLRQFLAGFITPANFPVFSLITGLVAQGVISKLGTALAGILRFARPVITFLGRLSKSLLGFAKLGLKFTLVGALILGIVLEWDTFVQPIIDKVSESFSRFGQRLSEIGGILTAASDSVSGREGGNFFEVIASSVGKILNGIIQLLGVIKVLAKAVIVTAVVGFFETVTAIVDNLILSLGGAESATITISQAMGELITFLENFSTAFLDLAHALLTLDADAISESFNKIVDSFSGGDFTALKRVGVAMAEAIGAGLSEAGRNVLQAIGIESFAGIIQLFPDTIRENLLGIFDAIGSRFASLRQQFQNLFAQGRLGGELRDLFVQIRDLFVQLAPILTKVGILFGALIGAVLLSALNVFISALEAILAVLPFIEGAIAGVIQIIDGFITLITSFATSANAVWALITGDTERATQLFRQAFEQLGEGVSEIFGGLLQAVVNFGAAVINAVVVFNTTVAANVLAFIPGLEGASAALFAFRDSWVNVFTDIINRVTVTIQQIITIVPILMARLGEVGVAGVMAFVDGVVELFTSLYDSLVGNSIIVDLINDIVKLFEEDLPSLALEALVKFTTSVITFFKNFKSKWIDIGVDIIDGILEGLKKNVDKVRKFFDSLLSTDILGLIQSKLGIFSPSTVMAGVGSDIIDGLIEGLESGESSLKAITEKIVNESLFQPLEDLKRSIRTIASREGLGSIKSNMSRLIKDTSKAVLKNINDILPIISRLEKAGELTVERLANTIRDSIGVDQFGIAMDIAERHIEEFRDLIGSYDAAVDKANRAFRRAQLEVAGQLVEFGGSAGERLLEEQSSRIAAVRAAINEANGGLVEIDNQILNQAEAEGLLNTELEKQLSFQEKLAALEEKRQKLAFLQQQLDLINLLRENKVDVGDIFEGIKFGLDANLEDIINASDRAVQAIIESVSQGLEIGSPSQVMVEFGQQALQGLEDGLTQGNLVGSLVNIDGLIRALADSFDLVIARIDIMAGKLNQVNLGSFINTNTLGLAATPGLALPAGGSLPTGNQIINNFNVTISGPADERAFIRRVVDTIRREL